MKEKEYIDLTTETPEEEHLRIPMFDEFDDTGEFSPLMNDLFGVMS